VAGGVAGRRADRARTRRTGGGELGYHTPANSREDTPVPTRYPKEQMHRIKYTKLTGEQITSRLSAVSAPASASPLSDVFAGKSLKIVLDGATALNYRFTDKTNLSLAEGEGPAIQAG
jgi:hypothetical protein